MADVLEVEIATPEKLIGRHQADTVVIPGRDGYMGILPGHAALLSELGDGTLEVVSGGRKQDYHITGGYVEIRDNHVRVLADRAQ